MGTRQPEDVSKLHVRALLDGEGRPRMTDALLGLLSGPDGEGDATVRAERVARATIAWERLAVEHPDQHEVLLLTLGHGLKLREVGRRIGVTHPIVAKRCARGMRTLRAWCGYAA